MYIVATHDYCKTLGNLALPLIIGTDTDWAIQVYINEDPEKQLMRDAVWLGAKADASQLAAAAWTWLDGQAGPASNISLHLFISMKIVRMYNTL